MKADYGLDAPTLVRKFLIAGPLLIIVGVLLNILATTNWLTILGGVCWVYGAFFFLEGLLMIWSSRYGKFKMRDRLLNGLELTGSETVLDVGCGRGLLLIGAAKRLPKGKAIGLDLWSQKDLSDNHASAALRNAEAEDVRDRVEIKDGDMRNMPFDDKSFNAVIASLSIHNIRGNKGKHQAIQEIVRVLKPGGKVVIMDIWNVRKYAKELRSAGMKNIRTTWPSFRMFPLVRIVTGYK